MNKGKQKQWEKQQMRYEKLKYLVYEMMIGDMTFHSPQINHKIYVRDEFEDGSLCECAYTDIYHAANRICEKLNVKEDSDVECILSSYIRIMKHLCYCMYDYGAFFGNKV